MKTSAVPRLAFANSTALRTLALAILGPMLLALMVAGASSARAQGGGLSYTLAPAGEYVLFERDDASGLSNGSLYGGELGFGFGRYLGVSALYMRGNGFEPNPDDAALNGLFQEVDLQRYGGRVRLDLSPRAPGEGGFSPFVSGGAGLLHFDPNGTPSSESIYVTGEAGATFSALGRYNFTLAGQALGYRYDPVTTFGVDGASNEQVDVLAPSIRAALQVHLGGRDPYTTMSYDRAGQQRFSSDGVGGGRFTVEPFYGRVEFADELKGVDGGFRRDQNVAGINAGLRLSPLVALRGFYWRGASGDDGVFDEFADDFQPIAFYGGELSARFDGSTLGMRRLVPYGVIGGGYVDVLSDYDTVVGGSTALPRDRYFATLGGGLEVPLSQAIMLQGGVRSLFMSSQQAEDVSDPDQVYANLMYSAGLQINLGGGGRGRPAPVLPQVAALPSETEAAEAQTALLEEMQRLQQRIVVLERRAQLRERGLTEEQVDAVMETMGTEESVEDVRREVAEREVSGDAAPSLSGRVIELPVPEVGEIYVRIGERGEGRAADVEASYTPPTVVTPQGNVVAGQPAASGGLSREEIASIISEELGRAQEEQALSRNEIANLVEQTVQQRLAAARGVDADVAARNAQIRRLEDQIDALRDDLNDELNNLEERQILRDRSRGERPLVVERGADGETRVVEDPVVVQRREANRLTPTAGFSFGGPGRFLLGVRGDHGGGYRSIRGFGFRFMPEVAVGLGDGVGLNILANGVYDFSGRFINAYLPGGGLSHYVGAGTGLTTETGVGVSVLAGLNYETRQGNLFFEISTVNFFDYNRLLIGYRARL